MQINNQHIFSNLCLDIHKRGPYSPSNKTLGVTQRNFQSELNDIYKNNTLRRRVTLAQTL